MFHTVYNSYESDPGGRDYIGKRSSQNPYDDYKGSYKDNTFNPDSKIVIAYAKTAAGAVWLEEQFQKVFNVVKDPQYANRAFQTSVGFDRTGSTHTEEVRQKLREANTGKKHTEETKQKMSKSKTGSQNPNFGKPLKEETKEKIRDKMSGEKSPCFGRRGDKHPMFGRTGERNPMYGRKRPDFSEILSQRIGENNPNYGKKWWVNREGGTQFCLHAPGPDWRLGRVYRD
jgi:hypothetical protein